MTVIALFLSAYLSLCDCIYFMFRFSLTLCCFCLSLFMSVFSSVFMCLVLFVLPFGASFSLQFVRYFVFFSVVGVSLFLS